MIQKIQGRASVLSPIAQSKRQQLSMTYNLKQSPDSVPDRDQSLKDTWFEAKGQLVLPSGLLEAGGMTLDVSRGHWWGYEVAGDDQPAGEGVLHATVHLMDSPFLKSGSSASLRTEISLIDDQEFVLAKLQAVLDSDAVEPFELPPLVVEINRTNLFGQTLSDALFDDDVPRFRAKGWRVLLWALSEILPMVRCHPIKWLVNGSLA